jgi:hypothetical protein
MITLLSSAAASSVAKNGFLRDLRRFCATDRSVAGVDIDVDVGADTGLDTGIDINVDIGVAVHI